MDFYYILKYDCVLELKLTWWNWFLLSTTFLCLITDESRCAGERVGRSLSMHCIHVSLYDGLPTRNRNFDNRLQRAVDWLSRKRRLLNSSIKNRGFGLNLVYFNRFVCKSPRSINFIARYNKSGQVFQIILILLCIIIWINRTITNNYKCYLHLIINFEILFEFIN